MSYTWPQVRTEVFVQKATGPGQRPVDCTGCNEDVRSLCVCEQIGDVPGPLRLITDSSTRANNVDQHPALQYPSLLLLQPLWVLLGLTCLLHLSLCIRLFLHFVFMAGVSRKMGLRPRDSSFIIFVVVVVDRDWM